MNLRPEYSLAFSFILDNKIFISFKKMEGELEDSYIQDQENLKYENLNKYTQLNVVGQGSFGIVYKAAERDNMANIVAVKQLAIHNESNGLPIFVRREIAILRKLRHINIIKLIEICRSKTNKQKSIYLILEFCKFDLRVLIKNSKVLFRIPEIKCVLYQLLEGLHYVHSKNILHRDLKPENILVTGTGQVKLADFGLARFSPSDVKQPMTPGLVTLRYRPPELILGNNDYSSEVDMWSLGCIMAELYTRKPMFGGNTEQIQLCLISCLLGAITPKVWPDVVKCPLYNSFSLPLNVVYQLKECLPVIAEDIESISLLQEMIIVNPSKRISAEAALQHKFFHIAPAAVSLRNQLCTLKT